MMLLKKELRVAIVDDHQGIIDGYMYRLSQAPEFRVVFTAIYGEEIQATLATNPVDVLILDVGVPTSPDNRAPYPILFLLPQLLDRYPDLVVIVISMYSLRSLIYSSLESGASGYILKDDHLSIRDLPAVIHSVVAGDVYVSPSASLELEKPPASGLDEPLSQRQLETLSLCAAYPEASTAELADRMCVAHSTLRNQLSGAYLRLRVHNRAAAVIRARQLRLLPPEEPDPPSGF